MDIKLKNLKIYNGLSEETIAFTSDVYINGKKVAYAKNDGQGGSTWYSPYPDADRTLLASAETYCKELPPEKSTFGDKTFEIPQSLESVIDEWVYRVYNEKEILKAQKKLEKNMIKGLCFGTLDEYSIVSWKGVTIPQMMKTFVGREKIKSTIIEFEKKGKKVLNTNILVG